MPKLAKPNSHGLFDGDDAISEQVEARARDLQTGDSVRFSLRTLLWTTAAIALICFGLRVGWVRVKQNYQEVHIRNSLKLVALGMANYQDARGRRMPSVATDKNGAPLSSWRWQLMPYIDQFPIEEFPNDSSVTWDLRASWQAPINRHYRHLHNVYYCWNDEASGCNTNVFAIVGPDAAMSMEVSRNSSPLPKDVVLLMEVADSKTNWMEPGDYDVTELLAASGRLGDTVKGVLPDRVHVAFAGCEVWALSPDTPMAALHPFLTVTGAKNASRDELLASHRVE